jgi:hypothetical protein
MEELIMDKVWMALAIGFGLGINFSAMLVAYHQWKNPVKP